MALYGILADIHGNREALVAALALLDTRSVDRLLCLGDIVGYNACPDECAALIAARQALAIAGNHDLIGLGRLGFGRCSNKAMYALKRTRRRLAPSTAAYLASLPPHRVIGDIVLIHGGVRDVQQYMVTPAHIRRNAACAREDFPGGRLFLFGHTHEPKVYELHGEEIREMPAVDSVPLRRDRMYFINPGSIDASRKREHKLAEFALLDTAAWKIEFMSLPYDDAAAEASARSAGYRIDPWTDRVYSMRRGLREIWRRAANAVGTQPGQRP